MEVQAINAAVNNLTKGDSYKEEMALMMKPHANWEQYLVPAPIAIRILGQLMLISTRKDFKLTDEKCTFLRHPTSFRASLIQVYFICIMLCLYCYTHIKLVQCWCISW